MSADLTFLPRRRTWVGPLLVVAVALAMTVPFAAKPYHLDDPMYVWAARQVATHPLDPYGFTVNWLGRPERMVTAMQNPPLVAYYMAAVAGVVGWGATGLHLAFVPWTIAAALGCYAVADRFCRRPTAAAVLAVGTPAFVVSGTTLMCEMPLLACWTWAVVLWDRGSASDGWRAWAQLLGAGVLAAAAALVKYPGVNLVPLFVGHAVLCPARGRRAALAVAVLIPVAVLVAYDRLMAARYGTGLLAGAAAYTRSAAAAGSTGIVGRAVDAMCFVGGSGLPIALVAVGVVRRRRAVLVGGTVAGAGLAILLFRDTPGTVLFYLQCGVMAALGVATVIACGMGVRWDDDRRRGLFLVAWAGGVLVFAAGVNWAINVRSVLPMVPAVAVLVVRAVDRWRPALAWAAIAGIAVAVGVARADYRYAVADRAGAEGALRMAGSSRVWFGGHWGFQFYMEAGGGRPLDVTDLAAPRPGDVVAYPADTYTDRQPPGLRVVPIGHVVGGPAAVLSTIGNWVGAGFYYSPGTRLPFAIGYVEPRVFNVDRVVR